MDKETREFLLEFKADITTRLDKMDSRLDKMDSRLDKLEKDVEELKQGQKEIKSTQQTILKFVGNADREFVKVEENTKYINKLKNIINVDFK